jgi:hypothetical protein
VGSRIVKFQTCDRCGAEARGEAVTALPFGWARARLGDRNFDLCATCASRAVERPDAIEAPDSTKKKSRK